MTEEERAPQSAVGREEIARIIWHRWGDSNVLEWEDANRAEYLLAADAILALRPSAAVPEGLGPWRAYIEKLQDMCRRYLEPADYTVSYPTDGTLWKTVFPDACGVNAQHPYNGGLRNKIERRNEAFVNDIIYALDGPEQRTLSLAPEKSAGGDYARGIEDAAKVAETWFSARANNSQHSCAAQIRALDKQEKRND